MWDPWSNGMGAPRATGSGGWLASSRTLKDRAKYKGWGTKTEPKSLVPAAHCGEVTKLAFACLCKAVNCVLQPRFTGTGLQSGLGHGIAAPGGALVLPQFSFPFGPEPEMLLLNPRKTACFLLFFFPPIVKKKRNSVKTCKALSHHIIPNYELFFGKYHFGKGYLKLQLEKRGQKTHFWTVVNWTVVN